MSISRGDIEGFAILQGVAAEAVEDEEFRERLIADPKAVLRERGLEVSDDVQIEVLQNRPDRVHMVLPSLPADEDELRRHPHHAGHLLNWWPV